jgi:hypothetical protein
MKPRSLFSLCCFSFALFFSHISAQNDCEIVGFWRGEENGLVYYQDFNHKQIIVVDGQQSSCVIKDYVPYTFREDTVFITFPSRNYEPEQPPVKLLAEFINCDSLHLMNLNEVDGSHTDTIRFQRILGHQCDRPEDFVEKRSFFSRKEVQETGFILFVIIYLPVLIFWIFVFFRGPKEKRSRLWWLLALICLLFCYADLLIFVLLLIHTAIGLIHFLRHQSVLNPIGRVFVYGLYAGLMIMFEYVIRYGFDDTYIHVYPTLVPMLVNLFGFRLVYELMRAANEMGFPGFRKNLLISLIVLFVPQFIVFAQRAYIFSVFKSVLGAFLG